MTRDTTTDVAIAGAGLTGRLAALALAHHGLSVALIDPAPNGGGAADGRTTAIAYASARLFQRLDLWSPLLPDAGVITDILVTNGVAKDRFRRGGLGGGALHFPATMLPTDRQDKTGAALGYIIENKAMNTLFEDRVQAHPRVSTHYGTGVAESDGAGGAVRLGLTTGDEMSARVLIACDGKFSKLRARNGFRHLNWKYGQKAIAFNITHAASHQGVAHEVFYPEGPFALLPMKGNKTSIVWTDNTARVDALMALDHEAFLDFARDRIGDHLGKIELASDRAAFPLSFGYAPNPVGQRLLLAGDAAHAIHPIAGQGFNLAIKDIAVMADVFDEAQRTGLDIGHGSTLARYARWRRFDVASLALGTDALTRLFSNDIAPIRWARGVGLGLVQRVDAARVAFMRQAGADVGTLPSLMQPL